MNSNIDTNLWREELRAMRVASNHVAPPATKTVRLSHLQQYISLILENEQLSSCAQRHGRWLKQYDAGKSYDDVDPAECELLETCVSDFLLFSEWCIRKLTLDAGITAYYHASLLAARISIGQFQAPDSDASSDYLISKDETILDDRTT